MTLNYKPGLLRIWLVLSLLWAAAAVWARFSWEAVVGVPVALGVVPYIVIGIIRGFEVKQGPPAQTFDLAELRQNLAETQTENPEVYKAELEPFLNQLEAKYGNDVPIGELEGLQQLVRIKLTQIEERKQEIINRGAKEGKTIETEALRRRLEASKAAYGGPDRDAYVLELDRLLGALTAKYGNRIPVDRAYRIMQNLEAGRGYTPEDE